MEFGVLKNKKVIDGKLDLLSSILLIDYDKVDIDSWILVDIHTSGLLDLISYVKYGSTDYVDVLIKFNRINNPLEIEEGDIIAIPDLLSFQTNSKYVDPTQAFNKTRPSRIFNQLKSKVISGAIKSDNTSNFIKKSGNVII